MSPIPPRYVLLILLLGSVTFGYSQKEASTWYFSTKAGLKFDSTGVRALTDGAVNLWAAGGSSISDENGNLLFYTDGMHAYNRHNSQMPNGYGLRDSLMTTAVMPTVIVPNPASNNLYYIFCTDPWNGPMPDGFSYSTVDLTLNGGLGDVTMKKHVLANPVVGVLAAIQHANGRDVWVITHEWNTNRFLSFLVTAAGVMETPVISAIGSLHGNSFDKQMHVSPDGDKIAVSLGDVGGIDSRLEVFDFSVVSGHVSNQIFSVGASFGKSGRFQQFVGVEFSPNGNFLYVSDRSTGIFQFDLSTGNQSLILNSVVVAGSPSNTLEESMQLGPDGKIYIAHAGGQVEENLSRINNPNGKGVACKYAEDSVDLAGAVGNNLNLPIFIENYVTPPPSFSTFPCILDSMIFYPSSLGYYDSLIWDFGDLASGSFNRSKTKQPSHKFSSDGGYQVSLTMYFDGLPRRKVKQQIMLNKMAKVELGNDTTICAGDIIILSVQPGYAQSWSTGVTTPFIDVTKSGLYKVSLTNGQCTVKDSIKITVLDQPKVDFPPSILSCSSSITLDSKNPTFHVLWSTGEATSTIRINETGNYSVKVTNGKCKASDSLFVRLAGISDLTVTASKDSLSYNEEVIFVAKGSDIVLWRWDFGDGLQSNDQSPVHLYQTQGEYLATVTAINSFGCKDSVQIITIVKPFLFIPNIFTPNADGKNDSFIIEYNGEHNFALTIYNRWGREVYFSDNKLKQWDGGSEDVGIFYYHLVLGSEQFKGWIQLAR